MKTRPLRITLHLLKPVAAFGRDRLALHVP
jgi:hypothetical protein